MNREHWGSKLGFVLAAAGSAVGLANIVRFPYLVGKHGGFAFIITYLVCLVIVSIPVFWAELAIGRYTQASPVAAFRQLGKSSTWQCAGWCVVITGLIVSSFYSALAGWILGYFVEACFGVLHQFSHAEAAAVHHHQLITSPWWAVGYHTAFILICSGILFFGVRRGLERCSKIFLPFMTIILFYLLWSALQLDHSHAGLKFIFIPNWSAITPTVILMALGQSFFTLSAGQGTMITYASYLPKNNNLLTSSLFIVLADTMISVVAAILVLSIVFAVQLSPDAGLGLLFQTLPAVFSQLAFGQVWAISFFLLVMIAAITSEISAMEPLISHLTDKGIQRRFATLICGGGAWLVGLPCALSYSYAREIKLFGLPILEAVDWLTTGLLIPIGGLLAVLLAAWRWGIIYVVSELAKGASHALQKFVLRAYCILAMRWLAPILILTVGYNGLVN